MVLTSWTTMNPSSYKGQLSWPVHRHHRRHHHRRHPQLLPRNPRNKVDGDNALLSFTQLPGLVFYLTNTQLRDIKSNILLFFLKLKNMYWKTACFTTTTCHPNGFDSHFLFMYLPHADTATRVTNKSCLHYCNLDARRATLCFLPEVVGFLL